VQGSSIILLLIPLVLLYLLILRPARQRQRQAQNLQSTLAVGQEVMTTSGLIGVVSELDDQRVTLSVAPGVDVQFVRAAVGAIERPVHDETSTIEPEADDPPSR
jgi:preprotein translocase subunit YajC